MSDSLRSKAISDAIDTAGQMALAKLMLLHCWLVWTASFI